MSCDWNHYLDIAELLTKTEDPNKEAYYRCCISRAYYAVFNIFRDFIELNRLATLADNGQDHANVERWVRFNLKKAIVKWERLHNNRIACDYFTDLDKPYRPCGDLRLKSLPSQANISLEDARFIIQELNKIAPRYQIPDQSK